jgi:putative glutamine amidotransferase
MNRSTPPVIGITADVDGDHKNHSPGAKIYLLERYFHALERAGAVPLILAPIASKAALRRLVALLDGVVLSGGDFDIHPRLYGERPIQALGAIKAARTQFELDLAAAALATDLPLLGICGGAQAINVVLGGSLYQDIAAQLSHAGTREHTSKNRDGGHFVQVTSGTLLSSIVGRSKLRVSTSHHQSVKRLGRGLVVNAVADDGIVEGIESAAHSFVIGLQWHPEVSPHQIAQRRIFSAFVAECRDKSKTKRN